MKFSINTISKCSGRLGVLSNIEKLNDISYQTPFLLHYTKAASIPHLSREVVDLISNEQPQGMVVSVATTQHMTESLKTFGNGISAFAGLENFLTFLTLKDFGVPTNQSPHDKGSVPVYTKSGRVNISPEIYMNIIETSAPHFYTALYDGDVCDDNSKKRLGRSVERTQEYVDFCVEWHGKSEKLKNKMLIGPIIGAYNEISRGFCIRDLLKHDDTFGGYLLDGFHNGGADAVSLDRNKLNDMVKFTVGKLPEEKLKIILGAFNPVTVLEMVKLGVDVFDSSYPFLVSQQNLVLTFDFSSNNSNLGFYLDLSEKKYLEEFVPFVDGCTCLACQKHTRAYVYHLIVKNELLAPILINIHNLHHYKEYFKRIRECIANNQIDDLIEIISKQYDGREPKIFAKKIE